jgi:2-polyprenyl-3-methyl-5-hydroxy-6-metoxy-1,4-benzoquinol methylase
MSYDYEKLYASEAHALGEQTAALAKFIAGLNLKAARILDVGCGQGRDALPLARAGHEVTGVDLSPSGVEAMCAEAAQEGLSITGHVADITEYSPDGVFDILLIDRTLHMLDAEPRATTFQTLIASVAPMGWLILADETSNLPAFKAALLDSENGWLIERCAKGMLFAQKNGT